MEEQTSHNTNWLTMTGVDEHSQAIISSAQSILSPLEEQEVNELHDDLFATFNEWYVQHGVPRQPTGLLQTVSPVEIDEKTGFVHRPWLHAGPEVNDVLDLFFHILSIGFQPLKQLIRNYDLPYFYAVLALHQLSLVTTQSYYSSMSSIGKDDFLSAKKAITKAQSITLNAYQKHVAYNIAEQVGETKYEEGKSDYIRSVASKGGIKANEIHTEYRLYVAKHIKAESFKNGRQCVIEVFPKLKQHAPQRLKQFFIDDTPDEPNYRKLYELVLALQKEGIWTKK